MNHKALTYVLMGQFVFFSCLIICSLLAFNSTLESRGVSYFGINPRTVVPYMLGFLGTAWLCRKAALALPNLKHKKRLQRMLSLMAIGMVGVAITPYSVATWVFAIHVCFATIVFLAEMFITLWLTFWVASNVVSVLLFGLQTAAAIVSALSLEFIHILNYMFLGQVFCQAAFVVLFTIELGYLINRHRQTVSDGVKTREELDRPSVAVDS